MGCSGCLIGLCGFVPYVADGPLKMGACVWLCLCAGALLRCGARCADCDREMDRRPHTCVLKDLRTFVEVFKVSAIRLGRWDRTGDFDGEDMGAIAVAFGALFRVDSP